MRILSAISALLLLPILFIASAQANSVDIKDEIINRCKRDMGAYGAAMVKACVDQDIAAVTTLADYQNSHGDILARCLRDMREYGFALVKACADQDIQAQEALDEY